MPDHYVRATADEGCGKDALPVGSPYRVVGGHPGVDRQSHDRIAEVLLALLDGGSPELYEVLEGLLQLLAVGSGSGVEDQIVDPHLIEGKGHAHQTVEVEGSA